MKVARLALHFVITTINCVARFHVDDSVYLFYSRRSAFIRTAVVYKNTRDNIREILNRCYFGKFGSWRFTEKTKTFTSVRRSKNDKDEASSSIFTIYLRNWIIEIIHWESHLVELTNFLFRQTNLGLMQ